jgi:hypothetical protein
MMFGMLRFVNVGELAVARATWISVDRNMQLGRG